MNELFPSKEAHFFGSSPVFSLLLFSYVISLRIPWAVSWVKKWEKRLRLAPAEDMEVLLSRSRAHHSPYPRWHPQVLQGSKLDVRYLTHWAHTLGVEKLLEQALHDAGLR